MLSTINIGKYYAPDHRSGGAPVLRVQGTSTELDDRKRQLITTAREIYECVQIRAGGVPPTGVSPLADCEKFLKEAFPGIRPTLLTDSGKEAQKCVGALVKLSLYWRNLSYVPFDQTDNMIKNSIKKIIDNEIAILGNKNDSFEIKPGFTILDLKKSLVNTSQNGLDAWESIKVPLQMSCKDAEQLKMKRAAAEINRENNIIRRDYTAPTRVIKFQKPMEIDRSNGVVRIVKVREGEKIDPPPNVPSHSDPTRSLRISLSRTLGGIAGGLGIVGAIGIISRLPEMLFPGDVGFITGLIRAVPTYFATNNIWNTSNGSVLVDAFLNFGTNHLTQIGFLGALAGVVGTSIRRYLLPPYGAKRTEKIKDNGVASAKWAIPPLTNLKMIGTALCLGGVGMSLGPVIRGPLEMFASQASSIFIATSLLAFGAIRGAAQLNLIRNNLTERRFEKQLDSIEVQLDSLANNFRR